MNKEWSIERLEEALECAQKHISILILATPSGEARNRLTDSQIHLGEVNRGFELFKAFDVELFCVSGKKCLDTIGCRCENCRRTKGQR